MRYNRGMKTFEEIVRAIGHGFHPDTAGEDYLSLPEGVTPDDVDAAVADLVESGKDPYEEGLRILSPRPAPSVTVGAPVTVSLDGSAVKIEVDLSEFMDGAQEAFADGGQDFTPEEAEDIDAKLTAGFGGPSAKHTVTAFLWPMKTGQ
jgi:hypothetical protein